MNLNADPNYPIMDGFTLNTSLRCNLRFRALALQNFEGMRRASGFRSKYWLCPESASLVIPAYDSYEYGIPVVPGSVIWGFIFVTNDNDGPFSIQVTESCTDIPLFSEVVRGDNFLLSDSAEPPPEQQFLPRPLVVPPPGLLHAVICSQQGSDATGVQLVLCGGEPANL
jgi:hypothetical protein